MYRSYTSLCKDFKGRKQDGPKKRKTFLRGRARPWFDKLLWELKNTIPVYEEEGEDEKEEVVAEKPVAPVVPVTTVTVLKLDYLKKQNRKEHHTDSYGGNFLVLRRGQDFTFKIKLDAFDKGKDRLQIQFLKGETPQRSKGTVISLTIHDDKAAAEKNDSLSDWYGYLSEIDGHELTIVIHSSSIAFVGRYRVRSRIFDAQADGKTVTFIKEEQEPVYMLFNPWCKDDQVYMEGDKERDEYVMNESGFIWRGSYRKFKPKAWNFGQFSRTSLNAAIHLLEASKLLPQQHGNATLVSRKLSAMANSCDQKDGVLTGNWSGDYEGGKSPTDWNGSVAILEEYMANLENNWKTEKDVKFGQCWVFSGLLTTLCRTLGIPARSVTNFASAHDTDGSLTIDKHIDEEGYSTMEHLDDSVWNFHVWNEAWMKRPDLPDGYDGWQAIDSTPQEESSGIYQCGPASVKAIKDGTLYLGYDAQFIFSEVNGDRITWIVNKTGQMTPLKPVSNAVGKFISTKSLSDSREDLTSHYKYDEGSAEERSVMEKASAFSTRASLLAGVYDAKVEDVEILCNSDKKSNGDIFVTFTAENKSDENRTVHFKLTTNAGYYTGRLGEELLCEKHTLLIAPKQKSEKVWDIKATSYLNEIDEDATLKLHMAAKVKQTGQWFFMEDEAEIDKPELDLQVSNSEPKVGEKISLTIKMKNPVDVELTKSRIQLEGPGIQKDTEIIIGTVAAGAEMTHTIELAAKYSGKRVVVACFNSRQLVDITGSTVLQVSENIS